MIAYLVSDIFSGVALRVDMRGETLPTGDGRAYAETDE